MILLLTHRNDLQKQIVKLLQAKGYIVHIPQGRTDLRSQGEASHTDLVILDMHLDQPAGNLVLHNLSEAGYTGRVIMLFDPSQVYSMGTSYSLPVTALLKIPMHPGGSYDLGVLEMAVQSSHDSLRWYASAMPVSSPP
jgi:DNA-binding NtrC family response regulator